MTKKRRKLTSLFLLHQILDFFENSLGMPRSLNISSLFEDFSRRIKQKSRSNRSFVNFPIVFLFSSSSKLTMQNKLRICDQANFQVLFYHKRTMRCCTITTYPDNLHMLFLKIREKLSKGSRLKTTTWRIILGIKI